MTNCRCLFACSFYLMMAFADPVSGAIVVSGDPAAGTGRLEITSEMTFTIVAGSNLTAIVFDEWVISDGNITIASPLNPDALSYQINSGSLQLATGLALIDNEGPLGDVSANDGFIALAPLTPILVSPGDIVTLPVQSWDLPTVVGFNPAAIGTFLGEVFLTNDLALRISSAPPVPEPGAPLLAMLSAGGFASCRRRRSCAKK